MKIGDLVRISIPAGGYGFETQTEVVGKVLGFSAQRVLVEFPTRERYHVKRYLKQSRLKEFTANGSEQTTHLSEGEYR